MAIDNGGGAGGGRCGGPENPPPARTAPIFRFWVGLFVYRPVWGYLECVKIPNGCFFPGTSTTTPRCVTGGVFGNLSGITIYPER
jgi:hypothetical protein